VSERASQAPQLPGFVLVGPLGSGGYSDVYLYEQQMPRRKVAIKVLKNVGLTETLRQQFTAEANAMAELADHPSIVPVFAADIAGDGRPYIVMMYYPRPNLGVRAASERLAVAEVLRLGIQIASAVETAHRAGILHRDIKPANVLTSQYGTPGLTDFGIAAQVVGGDSDEDTGVSVPWSAPEVLYATAPASVRSDVYSLGATLWHLLVGRSPFEVIGGDNSTFALMRRARDTPPPATGRADVPPSLERLLRQTLAKDPMARPASALDIARALQSVEQDERLPRTDIVVLTEHAPPTSLDPAATGEATRVRTPQRVTPQPIPPLETTPMETTPLETTPLEPTPLETTPPRRVVPPPAGPTVNRALPVAAAPLGRERVFGASDPGAPPTMHRAVAVPTADDPPAASSRRRWPIVAGLVAVVVVVAVVLGIVLSSGHSGKAPVAASTSANDGGQQVAPPPGRLTIAADRTGPTTVRFSWTYGNAFQTDTYLWQTGDGRQHGQTANRYLDLPDPVGTKLCLQVKVVQADGGNATVGWPDQRCSP
jgi:serine/threonine protein kinase